MWHGSPTWWPPCQIQVMPSVECWRDCRYCGSCCAISEQKTARRSQQLYKADVGLYEAWQLWWETDVIKRTCVCFSFCICSLVFKLKELEVALSPNYGAKFADFCPSKCRRYRQPPSDLRYKITLLCDILTKLPWCGVLRPQRLEREKTNNNKSQE